MKVLTVIILTIFSVVSEAKELALNDPAPLFKVKAQDGSEFDLAKRKGKWTVLYFYPKADTPGCTKQACAFRDSINVIREQEADVFGVSINSVEEQEHFHKKHHLNFSLLADKEGAITDSYGVKMPVMKMSKRWTFIIDPDLKIRALKKDVDPAKDAEQVAKHIAELKTKK